MIGRWMDWVNRLPVYVWASVILAHALIVPAVGVTLIVTLS